MTILDPCPDYGDIFYSYHGTSPQEAIIIRDKYIDVSHGGGELGQGFYTGERLHEAKQWAFHKTRTKKNNVVLFEQLIKDISLLKIIKLNINEATLNRNNIKKMKLTRSFTFSADVVVSKIVGSTKVNGCQLKWESSISEAYLNGSKTTKSITW